MNNVSSVDTLLDALCPVAGWDGVDNQHYELGILSRKAYSMELRFKGVNPRLSEGWAAVAQVTSRIGAAVSEELRDFITVMRKFSAETHANEARAKDAVVQATEQAESILTELGLK